MHFPSRMHFSRSGLQYAVLRRDGGAQGENLMAAPEDEPQPRRRFGWLKLKCCPWKVCAAVVVFALALSVDNLLLRREIGRQRGLHQMKNEVIDSLSDSLTLCERRAARFIPADGHLSQHRN